MSDGVPTESSHNLTRRDFLKYAGAFSVAVLAFLGWPRLASAGGGETQGTEKEPGPMDSIGILDFAPTQPQPEIFQNNATGDNERLLRGVLGVDYKSKEDWEKEIDGNEFYMRGNHYLVEVNPKLAMTYLLISRYEQHGLWVGQVVRKAGELLKMAGRPHIEPLQEYIDVTKVKLDKDRWGNHQIGMALEPEEVLRAAGKIKTDSPQTSSLNLSLQLGEVSVVQADEATDTEIYDGKTKVSSSMGSDGKYNYFIGTVAMSREEAYKEAAKRNLEVSKTRKLEDKNPGTRIIDAYTVDRAVENIPKLVTVLQGLDGMDLFTTYAAGNYEDDLRPYQEQLGGFQKCVGVAEWVDGAPAGFVHGAEIYVPNQQFDLNGGSSFSSPFINTIANHFLSSGVPMDQIKQQIFSLCDRVSYEAVDMADFSTKMEEVWVLNPDKVKALIPPPKKTMSRRDLLSLKWS